MNWTELTTDAQEENIKTLSATQPVVIFKHSARCSISNMAKARMDRMADDAGATFYLLDVINNRPISMKVAEDFQVHHESPQALVIVNGECVFDESHNGILPQEIADEIKDWRAKLAQ